MMRKENTLNNHLGIASLAMLIIILCSYSNLIAQDSRIIEINTLPKEGILLDKGWKFLAGDNPDFAKPDFDDSAWSPINPTLDIRNFPDSVKVGISWLRLHIVLDNRLQEEQLALWIDQSVASEIYLNGKLIYSFGKVSSKTEEILAYNPVALPVSFPVERIGEQVLAVRYAVQPKANLYYDGALAFPLLKIKLISVNNAFGQIQKIERHLPITNTFRVGAFIILAILYLSFFIYNPTQKVYLFFFLFAIFSIPADLLQFNLPAEVKDAGFIIWVSYILWQISGLFLLTAMYSLLNQKRGWIFWSLIAAAIVGSFFNTWVFGTLIVGNLINLELVRTCFKALRLKTRGAWIITVGAGIFLIFMGAFLIGVYLGLDYWYFPLGESYMLADVLYGVGQLSIPVATTVFIALDFGFTAQKLKQKLEEVEVLSKQTLAQQKEKQQILTSLNETLEVQVSKRTAELNQSLNNLKATQSQLIQSEKMASLGELTAGIAHEIQNPLNFVNNFSEINQELADELEEELSKGAIEEARSIAKDIKENEVKINLHGKRADSIVKGMLEHSRKSTGKKIPTDLNALADEYLRLSYHGMRAKDKSFNADFSTDFDPNLPKVNLVPQDIGRVLLNLINNAFQACAERSRSAVNEKKKVPPAPEGEIKKYEPTVSVSTKRIFPPRLASDDGGTPESPPAGRAGNAQGGILISIKDNGPGIPDSIKEKIFQPFFTTKGTGKGTGLRLSLAYDIVKAHGGEIRVESAEGEGTEFIINHSILPT